MQQLYLSFCVVSKQAILLCLIQTTITPLELERGLELGLSLDLDLDLELDLE